MFVEKCFKFPCWNPLQSYSVLQIHHCNLDIAAAITTTETTLRPTNGLSLVQLTWILRPSYSWWLKVKCQILLKVIDEYSTSRLSILLSKLSQLKEDEDTVRRWQTWPAMLAIALLADSPLSKFMNPNPLDLPVSLSVMTLAASIMR